jgi:phosphocarrier protein
MSNTVTKELKIINRRGLHARASAKFVNLAGQFQSDITVSKDGTEVCGTSIMGLMMLAAAPGHSVTVTATGDDADDAVRALQDLVAAKFDED